MQPMARGSVRWNPRLIWLAAVTLLLAAMALIQITAALQETQTYDEAAHLAAGYSYLRNGEYHVDPEHPPLSKLLAALPLLALSLDWPREDPAWGEDHRYLAAVFMYRNRIPADTILLVGRSTRFVISLLLGWAVAVWSRRHFGEAVSLAALFLYTLDANVLAHGRYITNDMLMALATFLACTAWGRFLERRTPGALCLAGLALGTALISKFSAVFLLPVFVLLYAIRWWQGGGGSWREAARAAAVLTAFSVGVIALAYLPETLRVLRRPSAVKTFTYLEGFDSNARHVRDGHPSYLLGETSEKGGWWYYFPVAFAVKAPTALLLMLLAAAGIAARRPQWARLCAAPLAWYVLAVPAALYAVFSLTSRINIGVRHLLPLWPLLIVLAAAAVVQGLARHPKALAALVSLVAVVHLAEAAAIYPHHLSFFNTLAGGPAHGRDYLLDSNLDWGQDVKFLKRWLDTHGNPPVCLRYFGTADTALYGVPHNGIPATWETGARASMDCMAAISATLLHDVYLQPGTYQWLRNLRPVGRAGYSIYIYDLRRRSRN